MNKMEKMWLNYLERKYPLAASTHEHPFQVRRGIKLVAVAVCELRMREVGWHTRMDQMTIFSRILTTLLLLGWLSGIVFTASRCCRLLMFRFICASTHTHPFALLASTAIKLNERNEVGDESRSRSWSWLIKCMKNANKKLNLYVTRRLRKAHFVRLHLSIRNGRSASVCVLRARLVCIIDDAPLRELCLILLFSPLESNLKCHRA